MSSAEGEILQGLKWWGWGRENDRYTLKDPQRFWSFLEQALGPLRESHRVSSPKEISLPPSRLTPADLGKLKELLGESGVTTNHSARLIHALGKSYLDLLKIRLGQIDTAPDAVVFPEHEDQIQTVMAIASERGWALIPFGGGTSVVGGVEPPSHAQPVITIDLQRMNRVLSIDRASNTARVQSGIRGPVLENELNAQGYTLGHFPQSFEFSTLGGWIATRSAGQNSTKYGKIEHMVVSLRLITPTGVVKSSTVPAEAVGPSILQFLIGSEGTLGIITEAVVRLHPYPQQRAFATYLFPDFADGVTAVRGMLQRDLRPAVLRLSDPKETEMAVLLGTSKHPSFREKLGRWYIRLRGFDLPKGALLIMIFEGTPRVVLAQKREAHRLAGSALALGRTPARKWINDRFRHPYLRDDLLDRSVMVDALETAAPWENLPQLYTAVRRALFEALLASAPGALVFTHLSHGYPDGASLYFTFMARQQEGREFEQWQSAKGAATEAILKHGGTLSHHHGIGTMHEEWMESYLGQQGLTMLGQLKTKTDPAHIMNPGKLLRCSD